jgi:superfamily I DNA and RNA helicase
MQQITKSKKYQNGVQVFWTEAGNDRNDFFSFEDLIDQKINALDLLNNPRIYALNVEVIKLNQPWQNAVFQRKPAWMRSSSPASSMPRVISSGGHGLNPGS